MILIYVVDSRREVEELMHKRSQRFGAKATIVMQEDEDSHNNQGHSGNFDSEDKQLAKAYRLSGEAKIKGVIEFVDYLIESKRVFNEGL